MDGDLSTVLFLLLLRPTSAFLTISDVKFFADRVIKLVLRIEISSLAILQKSWIKHQ